MPGLKSASTTFLNSIWPIRRNELKKFVPLFAINAFIVFNYSVLKITKDSLVITAANSGAEVIPFIKVWSILPMAIFFTYLFSRLSRKFSQEKVFYIMMAIFLGFYLVFAFFLYPFHEVLHLDDFADTLASILPSGFRGFLAVFRNWSFTLFYVMAELWSSMMMTVLFWGFANEVTNLGEANRFYGVLSAGGNIATILAGQLAINISGDFLKEHGLFLNYDAWGRTLVVIIALTTLSGIIATFIFWRFNRSLEKINGGKTSSSNKAFFGVSETKDKINFRQSLACLFKSKYLAAIGVIVVTYNIVINMIEVVWKDQVKALYPNANDFNVYMGQAMTWIGIVSVFVSLFACSSVINRFGWRVAALVTPALIFASGAFFFVFILFKDTQFAYVSLFFGLTPLAMGVFFGTAQNIICRVCKYTIFDATKEIAFVPMPSEQKLQGKAAIDGIGSRLGKSGGSVLHQLLLVTFGSIAMSTPYVGILLFAFVFIWVKSINTLSKEMTDEKESAPNTGALASDSAN